MGHPSSMWSMYPGSMHHKYMCINAHTASCRLQVRVLDVTWPSGSGQGCFLSTIETGRAYAIQTQISKQLYYWLWHDFSTVARTSRLTECPWAYACV